MATKKRATKKRQPSRRKKKSSGKGFLKIAAYLGLMVGIVAVAGAVYYFADELRGMWPSETQGIDPAAVETVLIAGGVNLDRQRQVNVQGDIERWKVTLPTQGHRDAILRGLKHQAKADAVTWKKPERSVRKQDEIHAVNLAKADGGTLRLLLVVPDAIKPKPKPVRPVADNNPEPTPVPEARPSGEPMIAVILDDVGHHEVTHLDPVLELKYPITFAVLPFLAYSYSNAVYFHQNQYEVMLHMPMEPSNYPTSDPGEGAIMASFTEADVRRAFDRAVRNVPFIRGINNHMGSKITASRALMRPFLEECKSDNFYFIDSRTNSKTVAYALAKELNLRTAKRDVFLDSEDTYEFAIKQLKQVRKVADQHGFAILIGHPYPSSLQALAEDMPKMDREGYRFVFVSDLLDKLNQM